MAEKLRLVCWRNWSEWAKVYELVYSFNDKNCQEEGLRMIDVWKSRSESKIPIAVECTARLVAADLGHHHHQLKTTRILSLAMALVRFVNGMVDQVQKGLYARPVQSIAEEIGLPDWLVDLRHDATHVSLPSMQILEAGLGFSLQWLKDNYWEKTLQSLESNDLKLTEEFDSVLQKYLSLLSATQQVKKKFLDACDSNIFKKLSSRETIRSTFLPALLQNGVIFQSKDQFQESKDKDDQEPTQMYAESWMPLFNWISTKCNKFYVNLLDVLLDYLEREFISSDCRKFCYCVVSKVIETVKLEVFDSALLNKIFHHCLYNPTVEGKSILNAIKEMCKIGQHSSGKIAILLQAIEDEEDGMLCLHGNFTGLEGGKLDEALNYFQEKPIGCIDIKLPDLLAENKANRRKETVSTWGKLDGIDWSAMSPGNCLRNFVVVQEDEGKSDMLLLPKAVNLELEKSLSEYNISEFEDRMINYDSGADIAMEGCIDELTITDKDRKENGKTRIELPNLLTVGERIMLF